MKKDRIKSLVSINNIHYFIEFPVTKCIVKTEPDAELFSGQGPQDDFTKEDFRHKCGLVPDCVKLHVYKQNTVFYLLSM